MNAFIFKQITNFEIETNCKITHKHHCEVT